MLQPNDAVALVKDAGEILAGNPNVDINEFIHVSLSTHRNRFPPSLSSQLVFTMFLMSLYSCLDGFIFLLVLALAWSHI